MVKMGFEYLRTNDWLALIPPVNGVGFPARN
jgi:hypothetical protein